MCFSSVVLPGRASFCTVRVVLADENDNAPRFRAVEYRMSIKANVAKGSLVTQIQATDPDAGSNGRITYSLYSEARLSLVDVLEVSTFRSLTSCISQLQNIFFAPLSFVFSFNWLANTFSVLRSKNLTGLNPPYIRLRHILKWDPHHFSGIKSHLLTVTILSIKRETQLSNKHINNWNDTRYSTYFR